MPKKEWVEKTSPIPELMEQKGSKGETTPFGLEMPSFFKSFKAGTAIRELLWAVAIIGSAAGIVLAIAGTLAAIISISSMHGTIVAQLDRASAGVSDAADSISTVEEGAGKASSSLSLMADSLRNFSQGTSGIAGSLRSLTSLPVIGSSLSGLGESADKIDGASSGLSAAADEMGSAAGTVQTAGAKFSKLQTDLGDIGNSLASAKKGVTNAFGWAQMAVVLGGGCMVLLFGSTLSLALSMGIPK